MNFEKRHISLKRIALAASEVREFNIAGRYFRVKESTAVFSVQTDQGEFFEMEKGMGFGDDQHPNFTSLFFKNLSSTAALEVSFYVSNVPLDDSRVTYVSTRPGRTYCVSQTYSVSNAADTPLAATNLRTGKTVADTLSHVIISVLESSNDLAVKDSSGAAIGGIIREGTSWQITTGDALTLRSIGASVVYVLYFYNYDAP